jgi:hypothetical protein
LCLAQSMQMIMMVVVNMMVFGSSKLVNILNEVVHNHALWRLNALSHTVGGVTRTAATHTLIPTPTCEYMPPVRSPVDWPWTSSPSPSLHAWW